MNSNLMKCSLTLLISFTFLTLSQCVLPCASEQGELIPLPSSALINLHISPHTHNDLGWLYTVESYFEGTNPRGCVKCILDNVTLALSVNSQRKFSYVEIGYFKMWWQQLNSTMQSMFLNFIANDQFEFLNAGFVMNDEGCTYYDDIIEQITVGHRFIKDTFNYTVQTAWHIDPFGHSASQASLFSQMGFDSFLFERIDYEDFSYRFNDDSMEMVWMPNTFSTNNFVMAHVNYMSYYLAPLDWCIDMLCWPSTLPREAIIKINMYVNWVKNQSQAYSTSHVLHHVGGDFEWASDAESHFEGLEVVIAYINSHPEFGINAFFSTPTNYSKSVYQELNTTNRSQLHIKTDDFMPYEDVPAGYWSGYYTSRASLKRQIRQGGQTLQSLRKLLSKVYFNQPPYFKMEFNDMNMALNSLEETMAILQHHDCVTGTATQLVTFNYIDMLIEALAQVNEISYSILESATKYKFGEYVEFYQCNLNQSAELCSVSWNALMSHQSVLVSVFNPSANPNVLVQLKVPNLNLVVVDESDTKLHCDNICDNYTDPMDCSLYFKSTIPPNTYKFYKVSRIQNDKFTSIRLPSVITEDSFIPINETTILKVSYNLDEFELFQIDNSLIIDSIPFTINYKYYQSFYNTSDPTDQASGAYIFRPAENESLNYSTISSGQFFSTSCFVQIQIVRNNLITNMKIYKDASILGSNAIEIETYLDSVDISDGIGKEITINIASPMINNNNTFYTDSNGLEMQQRILNYRKTWLVNITQPVAGNYFPVNSAIYIQDSQTGQRLTVLNDRSQGGSSLNPGEIELMIQRRILHDDNRGVGEPLNETDPDEQGIRLLMKHYILFGPAAGDQGQRVTQYYIDTFPLVCLAQSTNPIFHIVNQIDEDGVLKLDPLTKFYIRPYQTNNLILRLHNLNDANSSFVSILDSQQNFALLKFLLGANYQSVHVNEIVEVTLNTVRTRQEMLSNKFTWNNLPLNTTVDTDFTNLELKPLEMRAFSIQYELANQY